MEETKNIETNEMTEETGGSVSVIDLVPEETSGPSKGFVALVIAGAAAIVAGTVVAVKRHKKKKARLDEDLDVDFEDEFFDDDEPEEVTVEPDEDEVVDEVKGESAGK